MNFVDVVHFREVAERRVEFYGITGNRGSRLLGIIGVGTFLAGAAGGVEHIFLKRYVDGEVLICHISADVNPLGGVNLDPRARGAGWGCS